MRRLIERLRHFYEETLWRLDGSSLSGPARLGLRAARITWVVARDIADGQLTLRAMSLVYTTLLSLVPLLAVSFSVLKAFGAHNQIEPFLRHFLLPLGPKGDEITNRIIQFVDNTQVGVLGAFGLAFLLYTVVALIQKIERTFNDTWHVRNDRPLARRFSDYLSVLLVGPVLVFSAMGITASLTSSAVVQYLAGIEPFGTLVETASRLIPYVLVGAAFTFIYVFVPNTRVRVKAAALGALVAAVLWVTLGWAFASFIATSGRYTAIYSAFATLILFMIWLYLSWMILLVGGTVAFYVQHPEFMGPERGAPTLSARSRERLTLMVMERIASAFSNDRAAPDADSLVSGLGVPPGVVNDVVGTLSRAELIKATASEPAGWMPARPLEHIATLDVLEAARTAGGDSRLDPDRLGGSPAVRKLAESLHDARGKALEGHTVADWME